jgi:hypothetical protein
MFTCIQHFNASAQVYIRHLIDYGNSFRTFEILIGGITWSLVSSTKPRRILPFMFTNFLNVLYANATYDVSIIEFYEIVLVIQTSTLEMVLGTVSFV